jgi:hypothetical protein
MAAARALRTANLQAMSNRGGILQTQVGASASEAPNKKPHRTSPFADRRTDSQSVGFRLNGTQLGLAKLHVIHSKR